MPHADRPDQELNRAIQGLDVSCLLPPRQLCDGTHPCPNCEALARRVEELERAAKPRPIATAPAIEEFLAFQRDRHVYVIARRVPQGIYSFAHEQAFPESAFTHWAPMPEKPFPEPTDEPAPAAQVQEPGR